MSDMDELERSGVKMRLIEVCRTSDESRLVLRVIGSRDNLPDHLAACVCLCVVMPREDEPHFDEEDLPHDVLHGWPIYGGQDVNGVLALTFSNPPKDACQRCDDCEFRGDCEGYHGDKDADSAGNEVDPEFS